MEQVILNDLTLNFFINEAYIDWNNQHQIELRCSAILIALAKYLDRKYPT